MVMSMLSGIMGGAATAGAGAATAGAGAAGAGAGAAGAGAGAGALSALASGPAITSAGPALASTTAIPTGGGLAGMSGLNWGPSSGGMASATPTAGPAGMMGGAGGGMGGAGGGLFDLATNLRGLQGPTQPAGSVFGELGGDAASGDLVQMGQSRSPDFQPNQIGDMTGQADHLQALREMANQQMSAPSRAPVDPGGSYGAEQWQASGDVDPSLGQRLGAYGKELGAYGKTYGKKVLKKEVPGYDTDKGFTDQDWGEIADEQIEKGGKERQERPQIRARPLVPTTFTQSPVYGESQPRQPGGLALFQRAARNPDLQAALGEFYETLRRRR